MTLCYNIFAAHQNYLMAATPNTINDVFIAPLIVAIITLLVGNLATGLNEYFSKRLELRNKKRSYIELFKLEIDKLSVVFEDLINDLKQDRFRFDRENYEIALEMFSMLKDMTKEVIIFSSVELRMRIITTIDASQTLAKGIKFVERDWDEADKKRAAANAEIKEKLLNLDMELLKMGIIYHEEGRIIIPEVLDGKVLLQEKIAYIQGLFNQIYTLSDSAERDINRNTTIGNSRRTLFLSQIVDVKTRLLDLSTSLESELQKLSSLKSLLFS
mgnify:CR=1 FL=1